MLNVCVCGGVGVGGGGGREGEGEGKISHQMPGEGTYPDLEGLQAGCSDSILRKGTPASNANGPGVEGEFL